ncbi:hypothetical protein LWO97_004405 [Salmonella enterica subsp. enterica serovar Enteritidis]|nr:hypothetical protein [Salmonella enterica subsp. enterica serovar Enteritidis]
MIKLTGNKKTVSRDAIAQAAAASNYKKEPVRDTGEQKALRDYINATQPLYFRIFYALSSETAHRPSDVAALTWGAFDFENHTLEIAVSKQTNAAATRAKMACLKKEFNAVLDKLRRRQRWDEWERLQEIGLEKWLAELPEDIRLPILENAERAFNDAPIKTQKNALPPELFKALAMYRKTLVDSGDDDYVFPSYISESPRAKGDSKIVNGHSHISRVTFWRRMRDCVKNALKLTPVTVKQVLKKGGERLMNLYRISLYSLRKTSLHFVAATGGMTYDHLDKAQNFVGHSSQDMTRRYTHTGLLHALNDDVRGNIYAF